MSYAIGILESEYRYLKDNEYLCEDKVSLYQKIDELKTAINKLKGRI